MAEMEQGMLSQFNEQQMTSEQQERLEDYIVRGYNIIYNEGKHIANIASKDPANKVDNVATASYMVGRKIDLDTQRKISSDFGIQISERNNLSGFTEISAKTGQNVDQLFENVIEILIERYPDSRKIEDF